MSTHPEEIKKYDHSKLEFLKEFGRDLTGAAADGKIKAVIGREQEIEMMIETLCRQTKSNPVLIGDAGVGKTALVEGLALRISRGEVPDRLSGCRLFSVPTSALIAAATWYGTLEKRIQLLLEEARRDDVIIFIDETHMIVGNSPDYDSTRDIAQQLKPALSRGDIKLIGATTAEEYGKFIEPDEALARRFQTIRVGQLSAGQTLTILKDLAAGLSVKNKIEIGDQILRFILTSATRFLRHRNFPDKAIDLLEQTAAYAESKGKRVVTAEDARDVIQRIIGMPANFSETVRNLSDELLRRELLDGEQTGRLGDCLRVSWQGLSLHPERPNAVILLLQESPVRVNALAKTISENMFGTEDRVLRLNFSGLQEKWDFEQALGVESRLRRVNSNSPIARLAKMPWSVILCEGLEDCHHSVQTHWAQAIENGFLTDSNNKRVYLSEAVVLLAADVPESGRLGFSNSSGGKNNSRKKLEKLLSKKLRRLADLVVFGEHSATADPHRLWLRENLHNNLARRFRPQGVHIYWDKSIIESLLQEMRGLDDERDWEKLINFQILPVLLPHLEQNEKSLALRVKCENGEIAVETEELAGEPAEQFRLEESLKDELYRRVVNWLKDLYCLEKEEDLSMLSIQTATAKVDIYFSFWKEKLMLSLTTPVTAKVTANADILRFLLEKNMGLRFGKFALEKDDRIWLEYSMFADGCEKTHFLITLKSIIETALKYKQELIRQESARLISNWVSDEGAAWLESVRVVKKNKDEG